MVLPVLAQTPATLAAQITANPTIATTSAVTPTPPTAPPPETGINLTLSPSVLLIETDPGFTSHHPIKIRNNGGLPEAIDVLIKKVEINNQDSLTFTDFDSQDPILPWIILDQNQLYLPPDSWVEIDLAFSPPADAKLGYYFALLFKRHQEIPAQAGETQVVGAPALISLVNINSDQAIPQLTLVDFKTTKKWYDYLPVQFELTIKNTGNIHLKPFGNIFIDHDYHQDLAILNLNPVTGYILPGMTRTFTTSWNDGFPLRVYNPDNPHQSTIQWNLDKITSFRLGKYAATALTAYDDGQRDIPLEMTLEFWVIPWQIILVAALVIVLVTIGFYAIFKPIFTRLFHRRR